MSSGMAWTSDWFWSQSTAGRANRATQFEGVLAKHTGGSISTAEDRQRLRDTWSRVPTSTELFERTHCSNRRPTPGSSGSPTDPPICVYPKAARAVDQHRELKDEVQSQPDTPPPDDVSLWERSIGGRNKGRLFGFGTTKDPYYAITGSCSSGTNYASRSSHEVNEMREKMTRMEAELEAERRSDRIRRPR